MGQGKELLSKLAVIGSKEFKLAVSGQTGPKMTFF